MRLHFRSRAEQDIKDARDWYAVESRALEIQFAAALAATMAVILEYPNAFQEVKAGVRHVSIPGFPYLVYYLPEEQGLIVLRILHMKRHPDTLRFP